MFYRHYKGNIYYTLGVTTFLEVATNWGNRFFNATNTEAGYDVSVAMIDGHFYVMCEADAGCMLYMDGNGKLWLRPKHMFHGYAEVDGNFVKRFELIGC